MAGAPAAGLLLAARFLQGLGGAMVSAVSLFFALRLTTDQCAGGKADGLGGALATAGLMLAVYAIVNESWLVGVAAVVLLGAFVAREARVEAPLLFSVRPCRP